MRARPPRTAASGGKALVGIAEQLKGSKVRTFSTRPLVFGDLQSVHAACLGQPDHLLSLASAGVSCRGVGLVLLDHACWEAPSLAECDAVLLGPGPDAGAALAAGCRTGWSVPGFAGVLDEGG